MSYDWYNVYNKATFEAEDLVSKELTLDLDGRGVKEVLLTKGDGISVTVDDVFLMVNLNDRNPFEMDQMAVYLDEDDEIWVGFEV
jgi:hypothetical protein